MRVNSLNEKIYYVILALLSVGFLGIWIFINAELGITDLINYDEMASIHFATLGDSIWDKLYRILLDDPTNVPLFYVLLFGWIKLFGYSPSVMRLLPQIVAALSVFVMGIIGFKLKNKRLGIISILIAGLSIQVIYASFQLRAYSMLILGGAFLFLTYLDRQKSLFAKLKYLIALWFLSYTHFFGVLLCFCFFLWDLISVFIKKLSCKEFMIYSLYALGFCPYLILAYFFTKNKYSVFWPPVPDYLDYVEMLARLCPLQNVGIIILFFVIALTCICLLHKMRHCEVIAIPNSIKISVWNIMFVTLIGFLYSRYIDPSRSVWAYRYFLVVFPFIIIILASFSEHCVAYFCSKLINKDVQNAILIGLSVVLLYNNVEYTIQNAQEICTGTNYYSVAKYLRGNEDTNKDTTLIYFPYNLEHFGGWVNFYTEGGKYIEPNMLCTKEQLYKENLGKYDIIYTIGLIYNEHHAIGDEYIEANFDLIESNCDGITYLYRYEKKRGG